MSENRWGVTLEMFMNESVPRVSPVCPKCHKTYYAWPDVENYCTRCGAKLDGRDSLLSDYWNGQVGNYERDKKVMKERYRVDI